MLGLNDLPARLAHACEFANGVGGVTVTGTGAGAGMSAARESSAMGHIGTEQNLAALNIVDVAEIMGSSGAGPGLGLPTPLR